MPTQRLSMRRIREVLRLRHQGLTERVIARMLGVSNGVVHGYVRRARLAGLTWPLPEGLDDEGLAHDPEKCVAVFRKGHAQSKT